MYYLLVGLIFSGCSVSRLLDCLLRWVVCYKVSFKISYIYGVTDCFCKENRETAAADLSFYYVPEEVILIQVESIHSISYCCLISIMKTCVLYSGQILPFEMCLSFSQSNLNSMGNWMMFSSTQRTVYIRRTTTMTPCNVSFRATSFSSLIWSVKGQTKDKERLSIINFTGSRSFRVSKG